MATFTFELRKNRINKRGECPVVLRITSNGKVTRKNTGITVQEKYWDASKEKVRSSHPNALEFNITLSDLITKTAGVHAEKMRETVNVSGAEIISILFSTTDFKEAIKYRVEALNKPDTYNTYKRFNTFKNIFDEFAPGMVNIDQITPRFVNKFKQSQIDKGYSHNTVVGRMSTFRDIWNSMNSRLPSPFLDKTVTVGSFRPSNDEILTIEEIKKIWNYYPRTAYEKLAKDTFTFSYYAAGMRSSDVLMLKWPNIEGDIIRYFPSKIEKTIRKLLEIPLNDYTQEILSRYQEGTPTVFNKLDLDKDKGIELKKKIAVIQSTINDCLNDIARRTGIQKDLKFKMARTTFSRHANIKSNRNVYGIKEAMGHSKMSTTEIYLGNDPLAIKELLKTVYE